MARASASRVRQFTDGWGGGIVGDQDTLVHRAGKEIAVAFQRLQTSWRAVLNPHNSYTWKEKMISRVSLGSEWMDMLFVQLSVSQEDLVILAVQRRSSDQSTLDARLTNEGTQAGISLRTPNNRINVILR